MDNNNQNNTLPNQNLNPNPTPMDAQPSNPDPIIQPQAIAPEPIQMPNTNPNANFTNPTPNVMSTPPIIPEEKPGGSKMLLWIMVIAILVLLGAGGTYFYVNNMSKTGTNLKTSTNQTNVNDLGNELNSIPSDSLDSEFSEVDQELQGL